MTDGMVNTVGGTNGGEDAASSATSSTTTTTTLASSSCSTTTATSAKMESATVLANAFVPNYIRGTLNDAPSVTYNADSALPNLMPTAQLLRQSLCPHLPLVPVPNGEHGAIAVPLRFMAHNDIHYSLWYRQQQLLKQIPETKGWPERIFKSINENTGRDMMGYCSSLEELVTEERFELLNRYERYTQYNAKVFVQRALGDGTTTASFRIKGITGAKPAVQVGDSVALRTPQAVAFPTVNNFRKKRRNAQSQEFVYQVVELHCQCLSINRNTVDGNDVLTCSWVSDLDASRLTGGKLSKSMDLHIRIIPRTDYMQRCLTSVSWMKTWPLRVFQNLLYPTEAPSLAPLPSDMELPFTKDLNTQQLSFVRAMVQRTLQPDFKVVRAPLVLTGPAGTGKTKTLLAAMRQVLTTAIDEKVRILVCTPSHTAADVVTERLAGFGFDNRQVFRLYNADRPVATVPVRVLPYCRQNIETGNFELPPVEELLAFSIIVCTCYDAHFLYAGGLTNHQLRLRRMEIEQRARAEWEKCGLELPPIAAVHAPHFTHLFIDEAAQATEPETLIPLSVVVDPMQASRKVEIALVGDPRQLSPQVFSAKAAKAGLACSWMERLLRRPVQCLGGGDEAMLGPEMSTLDALLHYSFARDGHEQISFFLTQNYRGHPSFLAMPSALFYADKLQWASYDRANRNESLQNEWCERLRHVELLAPAVMTEPSRKQYNFPIHFRGVIGKDKSHTATAGTISEESWTNEQEAEVVAEIVQTLTKTAGVGSASIGVMAPFRGQVVLIRKLLRPKGLAAVNVGTIEDFQGIEMEVVVLSLTRSTPSFVPHDVDRRIGAFGQKKQSNVALTRAEQLQIVVGNPDVMITDLHWRQWLRFCLRNGLWYGEEGSTGLSLTHLDHLPVVRTLQDASENSDQVVVVSRLEEILRRLS